MTDTLKLRKTALEEGYFKIQNEKALERLKSRTANPPRISPVTGKPMNQEVYMGVVLDRCESGGVWLDNGELEQIIKHIEQHFAEEHPILALLAKIKK